MSAHLNRDALWELASAANLPAEAKLHLAGCGDCQVQLAQVKQAQELLQLRPTSPPPLNPIAARRIGVVLKHAAEAQLAPKSWWPFSFSLNWALAGVAALVLAVLVWNQLQPAPAPMPIARHEAPRPGPAPVLVEAPKLAPGAVAPARPSLLAKVTGAKKAKSRDGALKKAQTLAQGAKVATEAGGALWLALPDGSRAGLTGNTELELDALEDQHLAFTLTRGNVMVVARHLPQRLMTVKAGELEVRDIGTRFLVSRDVNRVLVAVEEGVVEINAPGTRMTLKAGRSVEWRGGQLREQGWAPAPPVAPRPPLPSPPTPAIEAFVADSGPAPVPAPVAAVVAPPPPAPSYVNPDDEWAAPPNLPKTGLAAPATSVSPAVTPAWAPEEEPPVYEPPPPAEDEEASVLSLAGLEQRLQKVARAVQAPFKAVGASLRETRSGDIGKLADEGNCEEALRRAEEWLADKPSNSSAEPRWRRAVMVNQMRCYTRLKRDADASRIKQQLD